MKITTKSQITFDHITVDTINIETDCNTIVFKNFGEDIAKIKKTGDTTYSILPAGDSIVIGGRDANIMLVETYEIEFLTLVSPGINIVKEKLSII